MIYLIALLGAAASLAGGFWLGYRARTQAALRDTGSIEQQIKRRLEDSEREAKEIVIKAQEKAVSLIGEVKDEEKERKSILQKTEERLLRREEVLTKEAESVRERGEELKREAEKAATVRAEAEKLMLLAEERIQKTAGFTKEEARAQIINKAKEDSKEEILGLVRKLETEKREEVEKRALDIVTTAIQRYSRGHIADITTTSFTLPSEDLKGKIIGREGRNIRTLERLTGAEFVIDETPDTMLISSFDPIRREVAKMALEKLIQDGRIQPAKIEEKVEEAQAEIEKRTQKIGDEAVYEAGILDLPKEIVHLLGRLHFRTSYGQNVLHHSIEVAHIAGMIAEELGVNVEVARKGGLLHDIGKAIDHEVAGSHVELGIKILKKYNIDERVIQAMMSHHEDYPFASPEAYIVTAADIVSAARPGARRGTLEQYVKRLEELERITKEFQGVKNSYAISAGRELRIFVVPEKIDDFGAVQLAKDVAAKIESEMKYPGDIKVTVIREVRSVEYAR